MKVNPGKINWGDNNVIWEAECVSIILNHIMADVSFIVALIACEFPCLVIDKGRHTHSLVTHFIMESSDISRSVGYQDTWREAQPSN